MTTTAAPSRPAVVPRTAAGLRRVDLRVVIGLLLVLAGVLGTAGVVRRTGARTPVLVVARPVAAGTPIEATDLRVAEIGLAPGVAAVPVGERDRVVGKVPTAALATGQVLSPDLLVDTPALEAGEVAVSVGIAPDHAVGGALHPGDRVKVLATSNVGRPDAKTVVLFPALRVLAVSSGMSAGDTKLTVTLAVRSEDAALLAQAQAGGALDLALVPPGGG